MASKEKDQTAPGVVTVAAPPKRDLSADLESAYMIATLAAKVASLPDVIAGALEAEQRQKAAEQAIAGLTAQKALLESDITGLGTKAEQARADSDRIIREATEAQGIAQAAQGKAEADLRAALAKITTEARQTEKALDDEHARRIHEREQELAHLDGQVKALTAELAALKAKFS